MPPADSPPLEGSFRILLLFDVADEIDLEALRGLLGAAPAGREPIFRLPVPDYVRFERPPVVEAVEPMTVEGGVRLQGRIKYYDYGVVCVEYEWPFALDWPGLIQFSHRWIAAPELESKTTEIVRLHIGRARAALQNPYKQWLNEDYYVVELQSARDADGAPLTASAMIAAHGGEIAQIVRGESTALSDAERQEVLQASMSYYPNDLLVAGWTSALIYDSPQGAAPVLQLLEYANTQLLEYRHYDGVLTRVLADVYKRLERRRGALARWRLAGEAESLNTLRLEVRELTERTDNAIKFLSDMFYARVYRLASRRVGVNDYRDLVDEKLRTGGELYQFLVDEFHQARAFILEMMVVVILVIELVMLFRGK